MSLFDTSRSAHDRRLSRRKVSHRLRGIVSDIASVIGPNLRAASLFRHDETERQARSSPARETIWEFACRISILRHIARIDRARKTNLVARLTAFAFDASAYGRHAAFGDSHRAKLLGARIQTERERGFRSD